MFPAKLHVLIDFGDHEEHFCGIILNLDQWFMKRSRLKIFLIYSFGCFLSSVQPNHSCNLGREHYEEKYLILFGKRRLEDNSVKSFSISSSHSGEDVL